MIDLSEFILVLKIEFLFFWIINDFAPWNYFSLRIHLTLCAINISILSACHYFCIQGTSSFDWISHIDRNHCIHWDSSHLLYRPISSIECDFVSHMSNKGIWPDEILTNSPDQKNGLIVIWWLIRQDLILYSWSNWVIFNLFNSISHLMINF